MTSNSALQKMLSGIKDEEKRKTLSLLLPIFREAGFMNWDGTNVWITYFGVDALNVLVTLKEACDKEE